MKIIGMAGSLRPGSYVRRLLEASARELPASVDFETWDGLDRVSPFRDGPLPQRVDELCHTLSAADGMLIVAPAYSVLPPQLGHALNWMASQRGGAVLVGKPVAVVTACLHAHEAMWTQTELRRALGAAGAVVYGTDLVVSPVLSQFDSDGRIIDPEFRDRLHSVLDGLCAPSLAKSAVRKAAGAVPATT
ncbi:NADPH-dependent FMN reductase [Streptosporangium sp. NBC_01756]|uniref:NADPH-dependent FMN reductase n=1 Tax=Streptosporangium sp. NBC_01756 TaxID=2975950 RepID=UPI002DDBEEA4|nr:NAD(P)H-dependent oxidoreductase [Streptosporangium sp. NBC_01756]WSC86859.1 NAD(P)H-dependent oxidoreductase [Streptosporangium sp. NBC_01756]